MKRLRTILIVLTLSACTPGGTSASGSGTTALPQTVTRIDVNISGISQSTTPAGLSLGFAPASADVPVGSGVVFVNTDNTSHTASAIAGSTFPAQSPLTFAATSAYGGALSQGFSTGVLQAGATSPVYTVDRPGIYLYGCFFHYSGTMRGEIVAH